MVPSPDRASPRLQVETADEDIPAEVIAARAYDRWVLKGRPQGTQLQDWLEAEAEMRQAREHAQSLADINAVLQLALAESERRREALRLAEERYRSIFDNAGEGIFQTTPEGRFLTANPAVARMLGFASPEALIAGVSDIAHQVHVSPERRAEFQRLLQERGEVQGFECQVYRQDGGIISISLRARSVRAADGTVRYYEGMAQDITERKRAEEALKDSEALYHSLVETLPVCIFRKDRHSRFTFANRAFCDWLKKPLPDIVGKTDLDFYPGELGQKYIRDDCRVMESGEVLEAVEEHQRPDEDRIYVQVLKAPLTDGRGGVVGMQGMFWDITSHKQAQVELARTAAEFRVARTIQQKLFPSHAPQVSGMDIAVGTFGFDIGGASYPAEAIGGDYYDFIPLPDGSLAIAIGDVSGHGVGPALLMAEARALLRAFAQTQSDVSTIIGLVNRVLVPDVEGDRFITLLLGKLNPHDRSMVYASAGHPAGYLLNTAGAVKKAMPATGIPLGILADTEFPSSEAIPLLPGDIVLLITDGIVEARAPDGVVFGLQRALDIVRVYRADSARQLVNHLYDAVRAFSHNLPQYDDITATIIKVHPAP